MPQEPQIDAVARVQRRGDRFYVIGVDVYTTFESTLPSQLSPQGYDDPAQAVLHAGVLNSPELLNLCWKWGPAQWAALTEATRQELYGDSEESRALRQLLQLGT